MNEFGEQVGGLADVFGIAKAPVVELQPGNYRTRGKLNAIPHLDEVAGFGVIGMRMAVRAEDGKVVERFKDGLPAVVENRYGRGIARCVATTPGVSYAKDAKFVPAELKEKWPSSQRRFINAMAHETGIHRAVRLSEDIVEAGLYVKDQSAAALVLANFKYEDLKGLEIEVDLPFHPKSVRSCESGKLLFQAEGRTVRTVADLGINDVLIFE